MTLPKSIGLRTSETDSRYRADRANKPADFDPFEERIHAEKPLRSFEHWRLYENIYPYDAVADVHHILIAVRKFARPKDMSPAERAELEDIKEELAPDYDTFLENFPRFQSVHSHLHFHLVVWKRFMPGMHKSDPGSA